MPLPVDPMALDIVGTGGDRFGTVNVSTMASVVAAASGVPVIKHGNRAASSASGSSDVLAALGVDLDAQPASGSREVLGETGITFAFASPSTPGSGTPGRPAPSSAMPTVFNFLGPLCNPARPEASAVGVAQLDRVPLIVGVFQTRGATALVFRGDDGLDELTTTGHSHIWEVSRGAVHGARPRPGELGIPRAEIDDAAGRRRRSTTPRIVHAACSAGERGAVRDIVLLNAAAGLVAYDLALDPAQVLEIHRHAVQGQTGGRGGDGRLRRRRWRSSTQWVAATQR